MSTISIPQPRTLISSRNFPRRLLGDFIGLSVLLWGGLLAVVAAIVIGVAIWGEVTISAWEQATQAALWYTIFIGGWVTHNALVYYIANGYTRREFFTQVAIFTVLFSAAVALMLTLGFLLERGLYAIGGWTQELSNEHQYSSPLQLHRIFIEYWLLGLVWTATGAMLGGGFYRADGWSALALIVCLVPIAATDIAFGANWGPIGALTERFIEPRTPSLAVAMLVGLLSAAFSLALTWPVLRDIAIKPKSS